MTEPALETSRYGATAVARPIKSNPGARAAEAILSFGESSERSYFSLLRHHAKDDSAAGTASNRAFVRKHEASWLIALKYDSRW